MVNVRERHRGSSYGTDAAEPAPEPDSGGYSPRVFVRAALVFFAIPMVIGCGEAQVADPPGMTGVIPIESSESTVPASLWSNNSPLGFSLPREPNLVLLIRRLNAVALGDR
jgi:hypothetical protein